MKALMDEWEHDEAVCPKCGHEPTRWRRCTAIGCDGGYVDLDEIDEDPFWYDPGDTAVCAECHGYGVLRWCPQCGYDLNLDPEKLLEEIDNAPRTTD